jgi:general stress protein 26
MDQKELRENILKTMDSSPNAVLSTIEGNLPKIRIVTPVKDGLTVWIATFSESRKVKQIKVNPDVQLLFFTEEYKQVVTYSGKGEIIQDLKEKRRVWNIFYDLTPYFSSYDSEEFGLIKVTPVSIEFINREAQQREPEVYKPN